MSAITTLILTMSVLMVLAVGGASTNAENSSEASDMPPSRIAINHNETMLGGSMAIGQAYTVADLFADIQALLVSKRISAGCDEWMCGSNHNETMLGGSLAIGQAYTLSDWLASIGAFFGRPTSGGCDEWGCGMNHNETMLGGSLAIGQAYSVTDSVSDLLASIQAFFGKPTAGGGGCDEWTCGCNHNETMLVNAAPTQTTNIRDEWLTSFQAFFSTKPTPVGCDDWGCGTNHNETMLTVR